MAGQRWRLDGADWLFAFVALLMLDDLFECRANRAGLTRPSASPYGQRCALSSRFARLEPERRFSSNTTSGDYAISDVWEIDCGI